MGSLVGPWVVLMMGLLSRSMCSSVSVAIVFNIVSWWVGVGLVRLVV